MGQASSQASKQASSQASKLASKLASKQASTQVGQASSQARKQANAASKQTQQARKAVIYVRRIAARITTSNPFTEAATAVAATAASPKYNSVITCHRLFLRRCNVAQKKMKKRLAAQKNNKQYS